MATLAPPSPPGSPSFGRSHKSFVRKCERYICSCVSFFPLLVVYGLTTWAVVVQASVGYYPLQGAWTGYSSSLLGVALWFLLNWSYTTAVFVDPGSPLTSHGRPASLPSHSTIPAAFTVKSTGDARFCKKCQTRKPDRAHHCSTCKRCVLKMDHHCPWLATCVGLRNYKPFLLFLIYTSLFCWHCFAVAGTWTWLQIIDDSTFDDRLMPVNYILLTVLGGILGLVLTGFTGWHVYLACRGQTTIESLEKQRYLTPIRKSMQQQFDHQRRHTNDAGESQPSIGDQLREIHANALPGVTRPEEGEERTSPAHNSLRQNYSQMERMRERERYDAYQDEIDSDKLPNAFDLGWRRNLRHVLGEKLSLWWLPICNTTGDGWQWEASPKWLEAREQLSTDREARRRESTAFAQEDGWHTRPVVDFRSDMRPRDNPSSGNQLPLRTFESQLHGNSKDEDAYDSDDDDDRSTAVKEREPLTTQRQQPTSNWNDIPEGFLDAPRRGAANGAQRPRSRGSMRKTAFG